MSEERSCSCGIIGGCDYHQLQQAIRALDAEREARAVAEQVADTWRAAVESANRISQRERERAERAEAALAKAAALAAKWERFAGSLLCLSGPESDRVFICARELRSALAAPQPKETP